jgi:hypothetical protein
MNVSAATTCRHCGRTIRWARTRQGNLISLNPTPTTDGCIDLTNGIATPTTPGAGTTQPLYTPHQSLCPDTDTWRRT